MRWGFGRQGTTTRWGDGAAPEDDAAPFIIEVSERGRARVEAGADDEPPTDSLCSSSPTSSRRVKAVRSGDSLVATETAAATGAGKGEGEGEGEGEGDVMSEGDGVREEVQADTGELIGVREGRSGVGTSVGGMAPALANAICASRRMSANGFTMRHGWVSASTRVIGVRRGKGKGGIAE